jgi:hypothetical protein
LGLALGDVPGDVVGGGRANVSGSVGRQRQSAGASREQKDERDERRGDRVASAREREETMREAEREGIVGAGG